MTLKTAPVTKQQIPNMHQWTNWKKGVVYAVRAQLRDATELLDEVYSMRSVPRCYKQDKSYSSVSRETVAGQ
jgi:hypothetical protein